MNAYLLMSDFGSTRRINMAFNFNGQWRLFNCLDDCGVRAGNWDADR